MSQLITQLDHKIADWYRAATLTERAAVGRTAFSRPAGFEFNSELAAKRLERWRSQPSFTDDALFEQRLALDNLTQAEFLQILGEPVEGLQERFAETPAWVSFLKAAFSDVLAGENREDIEPVENKDGNLPPTVSQDPRTVGFLELVRPLIVQARRELRQGIAAISQTYAHLPYNPASSAIEDILLEGMDFQLIVLVSPALVLELQVARLRGQLSGDSPEARFQSFIELLRQPAFSLNLLLEYSTLARRVQTALQNRVNFGLEFLHNLCADWRELCAIFNQGGDPGYLTEINTDRGDSHRGGRAVMFIKFSSGLQLVYKPRSMAGDVHFQELLSWLNQRGKHAPFRTLDILNRDTHGWVEYVEIEGCNTSQELARFYERQGGYLALLYALGASDFHYGNLIAAGEQPVLVDLEALFQPLFATEDKAQAGALASQLMNYSVLRVGLLPQRIWTNKDSVGVETSGLGGEDDQLTPQPMATWADIGTDKMRRVHKHLFMPRGKNRPTLNGNRVDPLDYTEFITDGFQKLYQLLVAHRDELLAPDGPLACFSQDTVRAIARSTRTYELFSEHSLHADRLRDALELDRLYDKLWFEVKYNPFLTRIIAAERYDLHQGDVPVFTTRPDSRHLWTSTGELIPDFFATSGLELVQKRLQQLGQSDLDKQLWFIRASLTTLTPATENKTSVTFERDELNAAGFASREQLLAAARSVGDRLEELALRSDEDVSWIGLSLERLDHWYLTPMNLTLYDGLPGAALFLAYLGHCTGEERYTQLARATLPNIRQQIELSRATIQDVGSFEGWGGLIYSLTHLSALWNDSTLLKEALALVELLPPLIEQDEYLDIITGVAGCIGALLSLYHYQPNEAVLAVARKCGERLVERATPQKQGVAWQTKMPVHQAATGFGRGSTGMSWALLQLAAVTGETTFRQTGLAALEYERSVFVERDSNWPDFRAAGKPKLPEGAFRFMSAWCHGAPGIGLARLSLLEHYNDPVIKAEVYAAVRNTLDYGFGFESSLCHGDLGNIELPLEASRKFNDATLSAEVGRISAAILDGFNKRGWVCSNPLLLETPGFMVGLAGIGYGLLRLADPDRVPSALILEPPRS